MSNLGISYISAHNAALSQLKVRYDDGIISTICKLATSTFATLTMHLFNGLCSLSNRLTQTCEKVCTSRFIAKIKNCLPKNFFSKNTCEKKQTPETSTPVQNKPDSFGADFSGNSLEEEQNTALSWTRVLPETRADSPKPFSLDDTSEEKQESNTIVPARERSASSPESSDEFQASRNGTDSF